MHASDDHFTVGLGSCLERPSSGNAAKLPDSIVGYGRHVCIRVASRGRASSSCFHERTTMIRIILIGYLVVQCATFSIADDWQHWRGRDRNDIVNENSGWSGKEWPLEESWKINVGEGSTTPIVIGKRLFTMGWKDGKDTVVCLDATNGKAIWAQSYTSPRFGRQAEGVSWSPEDGEAELEAVRIPRER